jgi:hypothetical protein
LFSLFFVSNAKLVNKGKVWFTSSLYSTRVVRLSSDCGVHFFQASKDLIMVLVATPQSPSVASEFLKMTRNDYLHPGKNVRIAKIWLQVLHPSGVELDENVRNFWFVSIEPLGLLKKTSSILAHYRAKGHADMHQPRRFLIQYVNLS